MPTIGVRRRADASLRPSGGGDRRLRANRAGDVLKRRAIAFGIGVVVIVLLLLAVRGCLDARKERAYENYLRDLESLVTTSSQLSDEFFQRFRDPGGATRARVPGPAGL